MTVSLKARDLMDTNFLALDGPTSVLAAIKKMAEKNIWSVIVEERGLPTGVVTDRDTLRRCLAKGLDPASVNLTQIMSSPIITTGPDSHVGEIMQLMVDKAIRRIFIVDGGRVVGRVTQTMLFEDSLNVMMSLSSMRYQM